MSEDRDYGLVESFHIDNGELDEISPVQCFVLGVEWKTIQQQADAGEPFKRFFRIENLDRVKKILDKRGIDHQITFMEGDVSESWMWLETK